MQRVRKIKIVAIYLYISIVSVYMISISFPNVQFIDQYSQRCEVAKSIVERLDLSIPEGTGIKGIDGRDYSLYGLGWSAIAIPFYVVGKTLGKGPENLLTVLNPLFGGATVTLMFLFCISLGYSIRASLCVSLFYGIGSFAWPLAKQPFDHVVENFFVLMAVYSMYRYISRHKYLHLVNSAIFFGFAVNTRMTSTVILPALLVMMASGYSAFEPQRPRMMKLIRDVAVFLAFSVPFLGIIMWYNNHRFGSPFETGFQLLAAKTGLDFFSGTPLFVGLRGFLLSPGKGFFYYSPIAIFFFLAIVSFYRRHPGPAIAFVMIILSYLLFLSKNIYWHGDWAWGPRYLLAITPFVILPIAELLDSEWWINKKPIIVLPVYVVFALSVIVQIAAVSVHYYNHFYHLAVDKNIEFSNVQAAGIPSILEPPPGVYFDWNKFPIFAQFGYTKNIAVNISDYKYLELPEDAPLVEKIKEFPSMHVFDFWWVYLYILFHSYDGMIALFVLLVVIGICCNRIIISCRDAIPGCPKDREARLS